MYIYTLLHLNTNLFNYITPFYYISLLIILAYCLLPMPSLCLAGCIRPGLDAFGLGGGRRPRVAPPPAPRPSARHSGGGAAECIGRRMHSAAECIWQ